jgi:menaquinone-9 beta-reductase
MSAVDRRPSTAGSDVVVVGAGPAGLVTAIACAEQGLSVQVLDRRSAPIDKACGEGLMPDAVAILERLGVALPRHQSIAGIRYIDDAHRAEGTFPRRPGAGVRRVELHRALLDRARELEVNVRERVRVTGLHRGDEDGRGVRWVLGSDGGPVAPRWIIGADGLHSRLRHWSGLADGRRRNATRRFGIRRHFRVRPWTDFVEVYWSEAGEAYVTPVAADEVGVAILWTRPGRTEQSSDGSQPRRCDDGDATSAQSFGRLLRSFPVLADRIIDAEAVSPAMAAGPLRQRTRGVTTGNLALVGDAAGYVDAITGEGMALAFHQAVVLASSLAAGDLAPYPAAQLRHRRVPDLLTETTLAMSRHPGLRRRALIALAGVPELFDRILAVHSGDACLRTLASAPLARGAVHLVIGQ